MTSNLNRSQLQHAKIGSWFLGPRAENLDVFKEMLCSILEAHSELRNNLYPDPDFITPAMKNTPEFKDGIAKLKESLCSLAQDLQDHSIPFWSPRYNGHMNMDTAMASMLGYIAAMMYNPNNVASECSPLTTMIENEVGQQLCKRLGFKVDDDKKIAPWGHITCDGSVANLEGIWAARNLKFYPLSVKWAMESGNQLEILAPIFKIKNCKGETKLFSALTTEELLNLKPSQVLDIPNQLFSQYGVTGTFLESALAPFLCQSVGQAALEERFQTGKPKFFVSATKHYSWPKGGAITGMGSERFVDVGVDLHARLDVDSLRNRINDSLVNQKDKCVFGVIVIMGSTTHGACDPLKDVIALRNEYEEKGISFAIHCDAAWGGYFASALPAVPQFDRCLDLETSSLGLSKYIETNLRFLRQADSVTIDPHKSGYINYPAGGLCYRDGRMRFLITWSSPVVVHSSGKHEAMGVYGVEGSKPGAAPVAAWLTHKTIGLDIEGYGTLFSEAIFTSSKMYCHWATLAMDEPELIIVPFKMLPGESSHDWDSAEVKLERECIRQTFLGGKNEKSTDFSSELFKDLGGDLMINVLACNFRINGESNTDVNEANYLNKRIFRRLSVESVDESAKERPIYLTESVFEESTYGDCLRNYKRRLGLGQDAKGDLVALVNVSMSPWLSDRSMMQTVVDEFKKIALEEVKKCKTRNEAGEDVHGFIMQGDKTLFLVHFPMFNMQNHRRQVIVEAEIPEKIMQYYREIKALPENAGKIFTVANTKKAHLNDISQVGHSFEARMDDGVPTPTTNPLLEGFKVKVIRVVASEPLTFNTMDDKYPQKMPFFLYGQDDEYHIDHVLRKSPNGHLSADTVKVNVNPPLSPEQLKSGLVVKFERVFEQALQPLPRDAEGRIATNCPGLNFCTGYQQQVTVFPKDNWQAELPIASGTIQLSSRLYVDWDEINMDPAHHH